jgi:hypothetical protein
MTAELGRASPFSSVVAANGHGISDDFGSSVERKAHGQVLWPVRMKVAEGKESRESWMVVGLKGARGLASSCEQIARLKIIGVNRCEVSGCEVSGRTGMYRSRRPGPSLWPRAEIGANRGGSSGAI